VVSTGQIDLGLKSQLMDDESQVEFKCASELSMELPQQLFSAISPDEVMRKADYLVEEMKDSEIKVDKSLSSKRTDLASLLDISPIPAKSMNEIEEHSHYFESKLREILESHSRQQASAKVEQDSAEVGNQTAEDHEEEVRIKDYSSYQNKLLSSISKKASNIMQEQDERLNKLVKDTPTGEQEEKEHE